MSQDAHTLLPLDFNNSEGQTMLKISLSRSFSFHRHLHPPDQSCIFKRFISLLKEMMPHLCTPIWLHLNFCIRIVFVGACMLFLMCIYPIIIFHPLPPPVLSVPAISKGRVSTTSLQRSRSDVDVNAAAVAKHRNVGQSRAAGHLPPGSCSSLGKGPAR